MPIDTSALNSILQAYTLGANVAQQRRAAKLQEAQLHANQEIRTRQLGLQEQQLNEQKQSNALGRVKVEQGIQKDILTTGVAPSGFQSKELEDGTIEYTNPQLGASFRLPKPEVYAQQLLNRKAAADAQALKLKEESQIRVNQANADLQQKGNLALEETRQRGRKEIEDLKTRNAREAEQKRYETAVDVANIRAAATRDHAKAVNRLADSDKLLTPAEAETFQLPYGSTRKDAFGKMPGVKLNATQTERLATLDDLEGAVIKINGKLQGNEDFFKGPLVGGLRELARKVGLTNRTPEHEDLRAAIGNLESSVVKARAGTAFSKTEKELLENFLVKASETGDITTVRSQLREFLNVIQENRRTLLSQSVQRTHTPKSADSISVGGKLIAIEDVK